MVCMVCKEKDATVHLTQMVEGKIKKVDLCEGCAKAKGVDDPAGFSLVDLLLDLGSAQEKAPEAPEATAEPGCPTCGFTQTDFKKTGRLGCADCYEMFADPLRGLLKNMHKGSRHTGKTPGGARNDGPSPEQIQALQERLAEAVAAENYEDAARLRDQIKALKDAGGGTLSLRS